MMETKETTKNNDNNNSNLPAIFSLVGVGVIFIGLGFSLKMFGGPISDAGVIVGVSGLLVLFITTVGVFGLYVPQYIKYGILSTSKTDILIEESK